MHLSKPTFRFFTSPRWRWEKIHRIFRHFCRFSTHYPGSKLPPRHSPGEDGAFRLTANVWAYGLTQWWWTWSLAQPSFVIPDLLQLPVMVTRLFWMLLLLNANSQCVWGWILPAAGKLILEFIRISEELCKWMQASSELLYNWLLSFHKLMLCYFLSASGAQTEPKETYRCVSFTGLCTVKKKESSLPSQPPFDN